ncbi:MAG: MBL fold metallo-hydrolase [Chloroflexota bacterium]
MNVTLWGTRGSLPSAGPETVRYGGNTSCVEVRADDGSVLVLDAGSGIRRLGERLGPCDTRIDVLLTHLHLDHLQGIGFFVPMFAGSGEVHIWGPPSISADLRTRLGRYLSPPLFPVRVRDIGSRLVLHDAPARPERIGPFTIRADLIVHPGPTVGYRVEADGRAIAYLPDHEPALGSDTVPDSRRWTSGADVAADVDLLIHDAQYTTAERRTRVGWGHSSIEQTVAFASLVGAARLVPFHHDPSHDDATLDRMHAAMRAAAAIPVEAGSEGATFGV